MTSAETSVKFPVLLFDGECGLCRRVTRILFSLDRKKRLYFGPLQGASAQAFLQEVNLPSDNFDSLIFVPDWSAPAPRPYLTKTDGGLAACRVLGGLGSIIALLGMLPKNGRDALYRLIARWRFRIFGRADLATLTRLRWDDRLLM